MKQFVVFSKVEYEQIRKLLNDIGVEIKDTIGCVNDSEKVMINMKDADAILYKILDILDGK